MEHESRDQVDENAIPAQLKAKTGPGLGPRRAAFNPIPLTGRDNVAASCQSIPDTKAQAGECGNWGKKKQPAAAGTKLTTGTSHNPSVIVKPVNGSTTIATASTAASEFTIFCDEDFDDDCSQDAALDLSLTSQGGKGDADQRTDSVCDVLEAVGVHDRALRQLNLNSSLISNNISPNDVFGTPCSMRTAGKSTAGMSVLDMSIDAENIEPVCKKGRLSHEQEVDCFPEYASEILKYLLNMEKEHACNPDYMKQQPEINSKMRLILVDWMVEVADEYKLDHETLFLAVNFIDRFLSKMSIARQSFQLLGTSSMFIASKYEEIYPPDVNEFVYITDESYDKAQVLKMEMLILKTLDMNVSAPTTHYFLRRLTSLMRPAANVTCLAEYLCYLSMLQGGSLLSFYPSEIAFSSLILAAHTLEEEEQLSAEFLTQTLQSMSDSLHEHEDTATKSDLQQRLNECMNVLLDLQKSAATIAQKSIHTKYSQPKYFSVANAECMETAPQLD